jgi:hypothetical protein
LYHAKKVWNKEIKVVPIVVASHTQEPYDTIVRTVPNKLISQGNREIKVLLRRLKWHIEADKWDRRKDYYDEDYSDLHFSDSDIPGLQI